MDPDQQSGELFQLQTEISGLLGQAETFLASMLQPWRLYQIGIIVALAVLAWVLGLWLGPRYKERIRTLEGRPKWQLRTLLILLNRLRLILFVLMAWGTVAIMRELTWPSRSYIVGLIATIATAWLLIGLVTRFIRNTFLQKLIRWSAWIWVTLYFLGIWGSTEALLDSVALEVGEFRLSILGLLKALIITGLLFFFARVIHKGAQGKIRTNKDISPSMQELIIKVLQVVLFGAAFFLGLKAVGFDLTGLAVLSGAIGIGLGFGLQKVVSNLVSGVIILLDKSIKPGDVISLGDTFGWINSLGARYVSVVTRDGKEYLIPNEDLITGQVVNWSHSNDYVRLDIFFGTAYHDDPHVVRKIAIDAAKGVDRVLTWRPPVCHIVGFGDSSVDYILRFWIEDPTGGLTNIRGNVFLALWDAFKEHNISIPFPQREVRMLADEDPSQPSDSKAKAPGAAGKAD
ncbi:mechanosensitive ion channel family protein [Vannielia litorea]|uniref:Mechanosensitive ion channel n=1 Tax=Vannielia litorea TaxID=1217970 RepID=A0A1N6H6D4_9RHOB|nr:mechanosensitive ion channel domain-containing protein [Vannielia litorea]SIO15302.1 Mechanosensitive ion channel [Vannielia litorea]